MFDPCVLGKGNRATSMWEKQTLANRETRWDDTPCSWAWAGLGQIDEDTADRIDRQRLGRAGAADLIRTHFPADALVPRIEAVLQRAADSG